MEQPKILNKKIVCETKWLRVVLITYLDKNGIERSYESCERNRTDSGAHAVIIVASKGNKVLILRQFRPALGQYCLEFPAGLIDGNESAEDAALRELKEETGFIGKCIDISPKTYNDPGLSNASSKYVRIDITSAGESTPEPGEDIEVIWLAESEIFDYLNRSTDAVDARLWAFVSNKSFIYPGQYMEI